MNLESISTISWISLMQDQLGTSSWRIALFGLSLIYGLIILPTGAVMSYLERKLRADFHARIGPSRAGHAGIFQPLADTLKLLQKEKYSRSTWTEMLWIGFYTMAFYSIVAVMPLGSIALLVNTDMSAFLPFWAALVLAFGTMVFGLSQDSVPGWFGGVRVAAQALAGAFPAIVAILCVGLQAGGFSWSSMAAVQGASPFSWTVANPFELIAFFAFVGGGMILLGIPPLDTGLSMPDIHGGVISSLYGKRYSLFRFSRFYGFFLWSVIAVTMFLGAWILPFGLSEILRLQERFILLGSLELLWILLKTVLLMLVVSSVAQVVPRGRVDHVTDFSWKVLSPFSLLALIGYTVWIGLRTFL